MEQSLSIASYSATFFLDGDLPLSGLQLKLHPLLPYILHHCHRLVILLFLGINLHQFFRYYLKTLLHIFSSLCAHLQVGDVLLLAHSPHFLQPYLPLLVDVGLVAQDDQLHVRNRILFDLLKQRGTSFSQ